MGTHVRSHPLMRRVWVRLSGESGKFNFVTLVLLLLVVAVFYFGIMFVPPYIDHYSFEEKVKAVANMAIREKNDEVLKKEIHRELKLIELDLPDDAIQIERDPAHGTWIRISARYVREVELAPFGSVVTMEFTTDVMKDLN